MSPNVVVCSKKGTVLHAVWCLPTISENLQNSAPFSLMFNETLSFG
jgi:hypothetical protein